VGLQQYSSQYSESNLPNETLHFCVVCSHAEQVYLLGAFNNWSTTATPMKKTEDHVWQVSMRFGDAPAPREDFAYFVVDREYRTGRAPFGPTFLLPGTWATVVRTH
jgi:1,4-alpha-glucan branching enzyme